MEHWNVAVCREGDADYFLLNKTKTLVKVHGGARNFDMGEVLAELEEIGFPLQFTEGIRIINFTYIRRKNYLGQYGDDEVEVDIKKCRSLDDIVSSFVHEVGHHVDSEEDMSDGLAPERRKHAKKVMDPYAGKDDSEYFARGFEWFYTGGPNCRRAIRRGCKQLYRRILRLHKTFRNP